MERRSFALNICFVKSQMSEQKQILHTITPPHPFTKQFCVSLDNVISPEKCEALITRTELAGYEKAKINIGGGKQEVDEDYRNNDRCIIDDTELANDIFQRIQHVIPPVYKEKKLCCLNERLRFLRYDHGHYFKPHFDGTYITPDKSKRSYLTMMLYLNDDFEGGETRFLSYPPGEHPSVNFHPCQGSILLFSHGIYHEGCDLIRGRKYAMRTDVMFYNKS